MVRTKGLSDEFFVDYLVSGLKKVIKNKVDLF